MYYEDRQYVKCKNYDITNTLYNAPRDALSSLGAFFYSLKVIFTEHRNTTTTRGIAAKVRYGRDISSFVEILHDNEIKTYDREKEESS